MPDRKVTIDIIAEVKKFVGGIAQAGGSIGTLEGALKRLGPIGQAFQFTIDKTGAASLALASSITGVLIAAVTALSAAILKGAHDYVQFADKVDDFSDITGASAEESSKLLHAFELLGVEGDVATEAMFKFSRQATENADKLEALGVTVHTTADGHVDLTQSLYSVADAYAKAGSAAQQDQILQAAFGKGGAALQPILEQGATGLKRLADSAHLVFTEDDIERVKRMEIQVRAQKSAWDDFWASVGGKVVEGFGELADSIDRASYVSGRLDEYQKKVADSGQVQLGNTRALAYEYGKEWDAIHEANIALQVHADAEKRAADEAARLAAQVNGAIAAIESVQSASFAATRAYLAVLGSQGKVTDAQKKYNDAVKEHGKNSPEAKQAALDLNGTLIDQEETYLRAGEAAKQLVIEQEKAAGVAPNFQAETQAEIDKLVELSKTLAPNSPLLRYLEAFIAQLRGGLPKNPIAITLTGGNPSGVGFTSGTAPAAASTTTKADVKITINGATDPNATARAVAQKLRNAFIP